MITLNEIVSSNISMLKEQEASLEKSLDFVRKAIQLFESEGGSAPQAEGKRGRPRAVATATSFTPAKQGKRAPKSRNRKGGKHIDRIYAVLKERKGPISSGELIQTLFKSQSKDKDIKHFGTLIYPVLTKAYKYKTLKLKDGKIHLA